MIKNISKFKKNKKMGNMFLCLLIISSIFTILCIHAKPIQVNIVEGNKTDLKIALELPNNNTIQTDLSFQLLTSKSENKNNSLSADTVHHKNNKTAIIKAKLCDPSEEEKAIKRWTDKILLNHA